MTKWRSWRNWRKAGPDLIHIGLIGLIILGLLTPVIREEASLTLTSGDRLELRAGTVLEVTALDFSTYQDGRPSSWQAELLIDDKPEILKVNHPVKVGGVRFFLTGFGSRPELLYRESGERGEEVKTIDLTGDIFLRGEEWRLKELRRDGAEDWIILLESHGESLRLSTSESREDFEVLKVQLYNEVVLLLVYNPLVPSLFWIFGIICLGFVITFLSRMREGRV